ncbi:MAG: tetratricopeptide repeat protein [Acidobacteria bacterium]|nr:tetratricopeptide repeat protein [Acidobacteriota bacterium]
MAVAVAIPAPTLLRALQDRSATAVSASGSTDALVAQAQAALAKGDKAEAQRLFRRVVARDPRNLISHTYLGILADEAGQLGEAEKQFAAAATVAPNSAEAHNNYGAVLVKLGRRRQAAAEFQTSLRINPRQAGALVNLAQIRAAAGSVEDNRAARNLFEQAQEIAPDAEIARAIVVLDLKLHEVERAGTDFNRYASLVANAPSPVSSAAARAEVGAALLEAGLPKQAAGEMDAAVVADPSNTKNVLLLARAYQEQKELPAAGRTLEAAIARGSQSAAIYAALAEVYDATGHVEHAIPTMHRAVELDPSSEAYHFRYAMLLTDSQAPQAAVIRLREALEQFPRSAKLWFAMGLAQFQDNKSDDAARAFARALEFDPRLSPAFAYLGMIDVDRGKIPDAVEAYHKALALDERSPVNHFLLAEALQKLNPPDDRGAEGQLHRALALDPAMQQAHLALGKLFLRSDQLQEAATELETVIKADPNAAEAYYQLGRVYMRQKRRDEAQAVMAKFEQLSNQEKQQSENRRREIVRRLADVRF